MWIVSTPIVPKNWLAGKQLSSVQKMVSDIPLVVAMTPPIMVTSKRKSTNWNAELGFTCGSLQTMSGPPLSGTQPKREWGSNWVPWASPWCPCFRMVPLWLWKGNDGTPLEYLLLRMSMPRFWLLAPIWVKVGSCDRKLGRCSMSERPFCLHPWESRLPWNCGKNRLIFRNWKNEMTVER